MDKGVKYEFTGIPAMDNAPGAWCFISMPQDMSSGLREVFKEEEQGWGRLKAIARIGNTEWKTAIWYDTKANTYLLPLKAEIRKKEKLEMNVETKVVVWV